MKLWPLQTRQPVVGLVLSAITGIVVADRCHVPLVAAFGIAAVAMLVMLCRPAAVTCWLFCAALFFELHTIRHWNGDAQWLAGILARGPRVVHASGIVSSEPEKPREWSLHPPWRFTLRLESAGIRGESFPLNALVNVSWQGAAPQYGDRVSLVGGAVNLESKRNPGEFDFTRFQQRHGIYSEIHARYEMDCRVIAHRHGNPVQAFGLAARRWIQRRLEADLADSPDVVAVVEGVVIGLRGESPGDLTLLLQRTGTVHLFVVSGLNVAMLSFLVFVILRPLALPRNVVLVLVILVLAAYAVVTGLRTSTVRSTIMAILFLLAAIFDRRAFSYNSLATAAFGLLLFDTEELFFPGFQFSFTLVAVIIALTGPLQRKFESYGQPDPFLPRVLWSWPIRCWVWAWKGFCGAAGISLACWIGSLIFTIGYFHLFSPASVVANMLAVPVAFGILSLGLGSILSSAISWHAVVLFNNANWFLARLLLYLLNLCAHLPGGFLYVENPSFEARPVCELNVLHLGDGVTATHVRAGHSDWLIDCGDAPRYEGVVLPYLRSRGVNWLDGLVLTHGNSREIGAALTVLADFKPRLLAESMLHDRSTTRNHLHTALVAQQRGKGLYARDDFIHLGKGATVRVLYPPIGLKRSTAADMALVLQLECAGTRVLLMSDTGFFTEQWLLENEPDLRSDIVIKGQHTRDPSGTADFLARVAPQAVICSALSYGQPVEQLDTWEKDTTAAGITVFRQDKAGAVRVLIRDRSFEVRGYLNDQTLRSRTR